MGIIQVFNQRIPPIQYPKVGLSVFTVIQEFLPTNFTYSRLAVTSTKVRQNLFACALRNNRHLYISIENKRMPPIQPKTVQQMVEFSENITIYMEWCREIPGHQWIENLDLLSGYLFNSICFHKFDKNFSNTRVSISSASNIINSMLTSDPEKLFHYPYLANPLSEGKLDNFLNLMSSIKGFRNIEIRDLRFFYNYSQKEGLQSATNEVFLRLRINQIRNSKYFTEALEFKNCRFFGSYQLYFPYIFPQLKVFKLHGAKINEIYYFNQFPCLEKLQISNTQIINRYTDQNNDTIYAHLYSGMPFQMIVKIIFGIGNISVSDKPKLFSYIEADVNFNNSIYISQKVNMALIGAIPICKLTDYESEFSFEMISTFMDAQLESSKDYQPIELKIAKFSEKLSQTRQQHAELCFFQMLRQNALQFNLDLSSIQYPGNETLRIDIRIRDKVARQLVLLYDGKQKGSRFRISGIQEHKFIGCSLNFEDKLEF